MDDNNLFDLKLKRDQDIPASVRNALIDTVDTLDTCWVAVQAVFGSRATPEQALALMPIVLHRADEARRPPSA